MKESIKTVKNIFEKIFYSKIFWPIISKEIKNEFTSNKIGRILIVLYTILYIPLWVLPIYQIISEWFGLYDIVTYVLLSFAIILIIPYKILLTIIFIWFNYIKWE